MKRPRVVIVRGHQVTPWGVRQWEPLTDRFEIVVLTTGSNLFTVQTPLTCRRVRAMRDLFPRGRLGDVVTRIPGDRYLGLGRALREADIVDAAELGYWYSMQCARLKPRLGYRLVLNVAETLPFLGTYRNLRTRPYRRLVLKRTDRFLPITERARAGLLLEGAPAERITVCPPGTDVSLFDLPASDLSPRKPRILSVGRLVWEKGHQDVMRALAALRKGLVDAPEAARQAELAIVGAGPEEKRLRRYARELGITEAVTFVPFSRHDEMPALYGSASCLVLASLPVWFWEEQFGVVLAEAIAARLPILASTCGAIPEVAGAAASYFPAGDWLGLARLLAEGPLAGVPTERSDRGRELRERYSLYAAADRLAAVYDELLSA